MVWVEAGREVYGALIDHDGTPSSAGVIPIAVSGSFVISRKEDALMNDSVESDALHARDRCAC